MEKVKVGIIGGSGLYQLEGIEGVTSLKIDTPFGDPSDELIIGTINGTKVAFLPRHGNGHRIIPTEINVKANIYALKSIGVERIISVSAVGSLKEEIKPLDILIPDQIIDKTRLRALSFFGKGAVAHVGIANPYCPILNKIINEICEKLHYDTHNGGTYLCIEGPQFSTKAESKSFQLLGADIIGMTSVPEARMAREAEICYSTIALVTDYDVWHESGEVTIEMVIANLNKNLKKAKSILKELIPQIANTSYCSCSDALKDAIITPFELIPEKTKNELSFLLKKYM
ncbi:MAG: S-methyl-5'-thioadenosine phosphorylase [bacterium]|nr:S-methyl-5'-thioadenosine phosphorylase [bacterium]